MPGPEIARNESEMSWYLKTLKINQCFLKVSTNAAQM